MSVGFGVIDARARCQIALFVASGKGDAMRQLKHFEYIPAFFDSILEAISRETFGFFFSREGEENHQGISDLFPSHLPSFFCVASSRF